VIGPLSRLGLRSTLGGTARAIVNRVPALARRATGMLHSPAPAPPAPSAAPDAGEFVPPGHFYSALPSRAAVLRNEARLFGPPPRTLPGIDLREGEQLALLRTLASFYPELPFPERRTPPRRYWYENPAYSYSDAIFLYCMIRHARPRRIVEVGSGHSSAATLDTNELHFGGGIACTFVEPHPELLRSLLRRGDEERIEIRAVGVQDVDAAVFERLEAGDILFVDSTHVSKIGSDVNHLLFEVLPRLAPGVYVHFHDVFFPFEYPREWILEGRAWTEDYLLRAFLTFNSQFEIAVYNTFLEHFHEPWFARNMPLCLRNRGGSIWLRRRV
jgi:predicted O-methyltransferase YrrM